MTLDDIKAKYGAQQMDAGIMTFSVPVQYSGRDVVIVKAANPQEAIKAAEKLIEDRFLKAPLRCNTLKAGKPTRTGIFG